MGLSYQPKAVTLSFKEGKPVTDHRIPNPDGEGTIVDYQIITSGEGELKMTTPPEQGGTLSPMPFAYVAPVED